MTINEYGKENEKVVLIIHNDQDSGWDKSEGIKECGKNYHIVALSLNEKEDKEALGRYLKESCHNQVYAICAFHNEWNICTYLMQNKDLEYQKIVVEENPRESGRMLQHYISQM